MSRIQIPTATRGLAPSHSPPDMTYAPGKGLAQALGWFSIGLGAAELFAPRLMGRLTGLHHPGVMQVYGVREIVTGIGVLSVDKPAGWLWGRVAGDVLDLATLAEPMANGRRSDRTAAAISAAAVAGVLVLDAIAAAQMTAAKRLEG
jgi:hypothetical protein